MVKYSTRKKTATHNHSTFNHYTNTTTKINKRRQQNRKTPKTADQEEEKEEEEDVEVEGADEEGDETKNIK